MVVQLALSFDPPKFDNLMDCVQHVVQTCGKPPKHIAADLELSPSQFSMMLSGYEGRHFPMAKLPDLIRACGPRGMLIVHWLIDQFLTPPEDRVAQAASALLEFSKALPAIQRAAEVVMAAQGGKKK